MKPKEPLETGQNDMFRSRLDQIIDLGHEKVILAGKIDWQFLSDKCGDNYSDKPGHPALSTRLMAGLHILKYADNLSDEEINMSGQSLGAGYDIAYLMPPRLVVLQATWRFGNF